MMNIKKIKHLSGFLLAFSLCSAQEWVSNTTLSTYIGKTAQISGVSVGHNQTGLNFLKAQSGTFIKSTVALDRIPLNPSQWVPTDSRAVHLPIFGTSQELIVPAWDSSTTSLAQAPSGFWRIPLGAKTSNTQPIWMASNAGSSAVNSQSRFVQNLVRIGENSDSLWFNAGDLGLGLLSLKADTLVQDSVRYFTLDTTQNILKWSSSCLGVNCALKGENLAVLSLAQNTALKRLWIGTERGLFITDSFPTLQKITLDANLTGNQMVNGIWDLGARVYVQVETNSKNSLYTSADSGKTWRKVLGNNGDSDFNKLDVRLNGMVLAADGVWATGIFVSNKQIYGMLKLRGDSLIAHTEKSTDPMDLVWGVPQKVLPGPITLVGIHSGMVDGKYTIATATRNELVSGGYGFGISLDSGKTFKYYYNLSDVDGNLKVLRCIPSYLLKNGESSRLHFRLNQDSKVDIDVFSYDMRPVRSLVKDGMRTAASVGETSAQPDVDFWDGKDDRGRYVSSGLYYIRVKTSQKEAWGKILKMGGRQ